ncbi:metal ABC transporter solute-binding protein, Zn/Mn family [Corynebacterium caspium]|uniref:metal ABC transporter solute-binding protein, Zn/Mn family n=1 Tax=Corynebacterium caspium TaxID=234828 RepID=UPI0003688398|nr:zinc ABC transporter substrate-binding protein [Corynebacterium caspium]WKD59568.1 putative periplasmic iron-binding protein precursor [Corynebacterium caspium DSM 44850]
MKTTRAIAAAFVVASLSLTACGNSTETKPQGMESSTQAADKPLVLATFTILSDMAQVIGGDKIKVASLTEPGAEIHGYDPTPSNIRDAEKADLILENGLNLEHWVDKLTQGSKAKRAIVTEGITPMLIENSTAANPHAWMSPTLAKVYVDNIVKALSEVSPENADYFKANAEDYKKQIDKVKEDMLEGLGTLPENERALVTCEGAFSYLAADAGLSEGYIWPVNGDEEITPRDIQRTAEFVKKNKVPAVFCESTVDPGPKEQLMRETGARDGGTLYVDSLSEASGDVPTYLDLITFDTKTIVEGLRGQK